MEHKNKFCFVICSLQSDVEIADTLRKNVSDVLYQMYCIRCIISDVLIRCIISVQIKTDGISSRALIVVTVLIIFRIILYRISIRFLGVIVFYLSFSDRKRSKQLAAVCGKSSVAQYRVYRVKILEQIRDYEVIQTTM
jgi:hypothetical protein